MNFVPTCSFDNNAQESCKEYLYGQIGLELHDIDYLNLLRGLTILALIIGIRKFTPSETKKLEEPIKDRCFFRKRYFRSRPVAREVGEEADTKLKRVGLALSTR